MKKQKKKKDKHSWVGDFYTLITKMCKQSNVKAVVLFEYIMAAAAGRSQVLTCSEHTQPTPPGASSVTKLTQDIHRIMSSSR